MLTLVLGYNPSSWYNSSVLHCILNNLNAYNLSRVDILEDCNSILNFDTIYSYLLRLIFSWKKVNMVLMIRKNLIRILANLYNSFWVANAGANPRNSTSRWVLSKMGTKIFKRLCWHKTEWYDSLKKLFLTRSSYTFLNALIWTNSLIIKL